MPRQVDPEERRAEIIQAALRCLATGGPKALTIRGIAREMGGSATTVTHYYPTRLAILEDLKVRLEHEWWVELEEITAANPDPGDRLWATLVWLLPIGDVAKREEQMRFAVLAAGEMSILDPLRDRFNTKMAEHLTQCLEPITPEGTAAETAKVLRVIVSGIVLSSAEYPGEWTPQAQLDFLAGTMQKLGLPHGD